MTDLRLLVIANKSADIRWVEELLSSDPLASQINSTWTEQLESGLKLLSEEQFDAALLDLDLPDSHGLAAIHRLHLSSSDIPVIVLAAESDEELALQAVQVGAQACLAIGQVGPNILIYTIHHAIERKRYELDLKRQTRELQALYQTSLEINAQVNLPALLAALVERATRLLNVPMGALYMLQPDDQTLRLEYDYNLDRNYQGITLQIGEGLSGRVAQTGQTIAVEDYQHWDARAAAYESSSFQRVLAVPLKSGGKVIGVINLIDNKSIGAWTEDELRLANLFADQVAIAVQNARLLEAERQKSAELARSNAVIAALSQVASRLGETLNLEQIIENIGSELQHMGVTVQFALFSNDPKALVVKYISVEPEILNLAETMFGMKIIGFNLPEQIWAAQDQSFLKKSLFITDTLSKAIAALPSITPTVVEFVLTHLGLTRQTSLIFLPLIIKDEPIGLMTIWGSDLHQGDVPAFTVFSNQVAVTLEIARLYNHIERLATTDELTQLYNRRGFFLLGEQQLKVAQRTSNNLLLIFIDVDQLKYINDHFGHKEGDHALIETAEALRATFRSADILARISGDEFVVLAFPSAGMGAGRLLERLQHEIDLINARKERLFDLSVSAGFAVWSSGQSGSLDELLTRADSQMYMEKRRKTGPLS